MKAMTIRELLTYLKALPKDTRFPVGLGSAFIINNVVDEIIFKPKLDVSAEEMAESIDGLLGLEVRSDTGARAVVQQDNCYAYFGLDSYSVLTPLNLVVLTLLRGMRKANKQIHVAFKKADIMPNTSFTFEVPDVWWENLTKRHQNVLALEYLTNQVLQGFNVTQGTSFVSENDLIISDSFGYVHPDGVKVSGSFGQKLDGN